MSSRAVGGWLAVFLAICCDGAPAAADVAESAVRATVRVYRGPQSGTGFVVELNDGEGAERQHVLVTAAHAFEQMPGATCVVVLRESDERGRFVRREVELAIRDGEKPLWVSHPEVDVAVIGVALPEGVAVEPFSEDQVGEAALAEERKVRVGQEVFVACFPAKTEANAAGFPVLRRGVIATYPLTPVGDVKTMFVDYSQFGGDSGAAVVTSVEGEPTVVGLVIAMQRQTDRVVMPFEERTMHTPLGLAIAVQSPLIRDTIKLWRQSHSAASDAEQSGMESGAAEQGGRR